MSRQRLLLTLGLIVSSVGLVVLLAPTLGTAVAPSGIGRTAPFALVGISVILLAAGYFFTDFLSTDQPSHSQTHQPIPMPERRPHYTALEDAFARRLDNISWTDRRDTAPANRITLHDDLREMAVRVLSRTGQWSRGEIESRLDTGSWTTNPDAAAFFTDDVIPALSLRQQIRSLHSPEPTFATRARHVITELATRLTERDVIPSLQDATRTPQDPARPITTRAYWGSDDETARESRSNRTTGVTVAALALGGLGVLTLTPALLLVTLFGVVMAGYARITAAPAASISITRIADDEHPAPGTEVTVTVMIENTGEQTLTDFRVIDGVPAGLAVTADSSRFTTALRPGKKATFTYTVEAAPGTHVFDPLLVVTRDVTGLQRREALVEATSTTLTCQYPVHPMATSGELRRTTHLPGISRSNIAGSGVEFHSVREYRSGDALSRINWKQKAKTGELTTVEFNEPRLTRALVAIDARHETYRARACESDRPLAQVGVTVAHGLTMSMLNDQIPVGVTALSPHSCWLPPRAGVTQRDRIRMILTENEAFNWTPPVGEFESDRAINAISQRVHTATQIIVVTPLVDDEVVQLIRRLDAHGYTVSVVSPPPIRDDCMSISSGDGYALLARQFRIESLRGTGIFVVEDDAANPVLCGAES